MYDFEKYINNVFILPNEGLIKVYSILGGLKNMTKNKNLENLLRIRPKEGFEEICSGCGVCEAFCHAAHYDTEGKAKSAIRISGENFPDPGGYTCVVCNQCGKCAKACPADAIVKEGNIYKIDKDLCVGCTDRSTGKPICVSVCPIGAIYTHPDQIEPIKCDGCGECVERCPKGALEYVFKKPKEVEK